MFLVLDRSPANLKAELKEVTAGQHDTVTVVCDIVGEAYFLQTVDALERGGRYTCSGAIAGHLVELDLRTLYLRDLTFHGSTALPPGIFQTLIGYIENNELRPMLAKTMPLGRPERGATGLYRQEAHRKHCCDPLIMNETTYCHSVKRER